MKKWIALCLMICLMITLGACKAENTESTDPSVAAKGVYISNSYRIYTDPAVPMPDSERLETEGWNDLAHRSYEWVSHEWEKNYLKELEQDGYTVKRGLNSSFAYDDKSYLFLNLMIDDTRFNIDDGGYTDEELPLALFIECFSQDPKIKNGISREEARDNIAPKSDLLPIDVTPDGLYEASGGQIFMQPEYSEFSDDEEVQFSEDEWYAPEYYYIIDGACVKMSMPCIGVGDIDGDGKNETCILQYGPTSGVFTFSVDVYRDGDPVRVSQFFTTEWQDLAFTEKSDRLCLLGKGYQGGEHIYDLALDNDAVSLSENGVPLTEWGSVAEAGTDLQQ